MGRAAKKVLEESRTDFLCGGDYRFLSLGHLSVWLKGIVGQRDARAQDMEVLFLLSKRFSLKRSRQDGFTRSLSGVLFCTLTLKLLSPTIRNFPCIEA